MWMVFLMGACCGSGLTTTFFYIVLGRDIRRDERLRWETSPIPQDSEAGTP